MQVNTLLKPTWIIPIVPEGVVLTKHVIAIARRRKSWSCPAKS